MFQLKGLTGNETAKIAITGKTQTLGISKQWLTYSFPVPMERSFVLTIVAKPKQSVNFQSADIYEIHHLKNWEIWNCGKEDENRRCDSVRRGLLDWTGSYKFIYLNPGMLLSSQSLWPRKWRYSFLLNSSGFLYWLLLSIFGALILCWDIPKDSLRSHMMETDVQVCVLICLDV